MRVLVLSNGIWKSGAQHATNEFLEFMSTNPNIEIKIIGCYEGNFVIQPNSIEIHRVPCKSIGILLDMKIDKNFRQLIQWADVVWIATGEYTVAKRIKRIKNIPIVAHIHSYEFICPIMIFSYKLAEICNGCSPWRIIQCKQGIHRELTKVGSLKRPKAQVYWLLDFGKGPLDYYLWKRAMSNVVESIDFFIAVSRATRDIVVSHLPEVENKIEVVYNPVAYRPWRYLSFIPQQRGNYIFYAGGANIHKGPHILLNAFSLLRRWGIDVELVMTGTAGTWVEALARRLGVDRGVEFLGKLPEEEYFRLMAGGRVTVMPSVWPEPFGIVAVESISLGVPVVGSNGGGIPEVVGNFGAVVPPHYEDVANAIVSLSEKDYDRYEMRNYAYEKFGEKNVEKLIKIFNSI